jgi:hypothetical protein
MPLSQVLLSPTSSIGLPLNDWLLPQWLSILGRFITKRLQPHFHSGSMLNLINITLWLHIRRREQKLNRQLITVLFVRASAGQSVLRTLHSNVLWTPGVGCVQRTEWWECWWFCERLDPCWGWCATTDVCTHGTLRTVHRQLFHVAASYKSSARRCHRTSNGALYDLTFSRRWLWRMSSSGI